MVCLVYFWRSGVRRGKVERRGVEWSGVGRSIVERSGEE